ncbi:MAG: copper amine oxidase N-terminal domain-containing protein [Bacillota bacterium]|nr:copper amine oxidase N-terminal domain-containing protein [Bacillota bacterium]
MKKFFFVLPVFMLFCMMTFAASDSVTAQNIKFTPEGGGKYIYCNNEEAIWRRDLSDDSNPNPSYIMNNDDLAAGKYSMFVSHLNHTELQNSDGSMKEMGFDIELDAQFVAKEDSTVVITAVGFEAQRLETFRSGDKILKLQSSADFFNAWSDYMQVPMLTERSDEKCEPHEFTPVTVELKKGEKMWLSKYISNYSTVAFLKPVFLMSDFEIKQGKVDVNIAALKSDGILGDRSHHCDNAKRGVYYRDRQYKGIADTLPAVNTDLSYSINDKITAGTLLPVKVYNQYIPEGSVVTKWMTNINPQEDIWSRPSCTESDMLSFKYFDPEKLSFYGSNVADAQKDQYWVFDDFHSDTKDSAGGIPNYPLTIGKDNRGSGCNLGNYGVSVNYHVTINNTGDKTRYLYYKLSSSSPNYVTVKDENGNVINGYAVRKNPYETKSEKVMACVKLPAKTTSKFTIEQILPANFPGGMGNSFEINDEETKLEFYPQSMTKVDETLKSTGREYYAWFGGELYFSSDGDDWIKQGISEDAKEIFDGNWDRYEIKYLDGVYTARWCDYDNSPYFYEIAPKLFNRVYFFDEGFNLKATHYYKDYPSDTYLKDGKIITTVGDRSYATSQPDLQKTISVVCNDKYIDFDVAPIIKDGRTLVPLRLFFESIGAKVDWDADKRTVKVTSGSDVIEFAIDSKTALVNGVEKSMDVPAQLYNARTLIPLRFMSEALGYSVDWDDLTKTITISTKMAETENK